MSAPPVITSALCAVTLAFVLVSCGSGRKPAASVSPRSEPSPAASTAEPANEPAPAVAKDPAAELHRAAIVIDTHSDVTQRMMRGEDLTERLPHGHVDLPRMREGGLDAQFLSIWAPPQLFRGEDAHRYAVQQLDAVDHLVGSSESVVLAQTAEEVRAAAREGKTAFLLGVEGGDLLGVAADEVLLERLKTFRDRGVRYMTLTWSLSNRLGGSSGDDGRARGLSPLGKRVVAKMNDLGMVVDVSHVSDATFRDIIAATQKPVLASHSSARALCAHPRNMTDDMLRAVRDNGGAVCINFGPQFLDLAWHEQHAPLQRAAIGELMASLKGKAAPDPLAVMRAANEKFAAIAKELPDVPASLVIDHIEHVAKVAGIDHVCLGSDFDGIPKGPAGLDDVSKVPFITRELVRRGFSEEDVRKVLGENVLRVLGANEG